MKAEDEAAIYLEECGINGDAMLDIHEDHVDDYEEMKGSIYVADLMAGFAESKLQALKDKDKLGQVFMNKFDCYNGIEGDGQEFPAMTKDKFVEVVSNLITNLD